MFRSRIRRVGCHAAVFAWSDITLDRSRKPLLACSRPLPEPRARVATPVLTSRTATFSTPSPQTPGAAFTPIPILGS